MAVGNGGGGLVSGSYAAYEPFGAFLLRPTVTNPSVTDRGFTGQRSNNLSPAWLGLVYMNARYYHPQLGRFVSPDSIVPEPGEPQSFNRYAYVRNSPMNLTDPSGHCAQEDNDCWEWLDRIWQQWGWRFDLNGITWTVEELLKIWNAGTAIEHWLSMNGGGDARGRVRALLGGTLFSNVESSPAAKVFPELYEHHHVLGQVVYLMDWFSIGSVLHELGHVIDNQLSPSGWPGAAVFGGGPGDQLAFSLGANPYFCGLRFRCDWLSIVTGANAELNPTQYGRNHGPSEDFAETFRLSVLGDLETAPQREQFMQQFAALQVDVKPAYSGSLYQYYRIPASPAQPVPVPAPTP